MPSACGVPTTVTLRPSRKLLQDPPENVVAPFVRTFLPPTWKLTDGQDPLKPLTCPATVTGDDVGTPACVTVTVRPATVKVPVRWFAEAFGATLYRTSPGPFPFAPDVIVIQGELLDDIHPQWFPGAVTVAVKAPPGASADWDVGVTVRLQGAGAACVTSTRCPAIVKAPVLAPEVVFAVTVYRTSPLPVPLAPALMVIHEEPSLTADVQPQLGADVVTVTVCDPPPAGTDCELGATV